jgi:hypothetical protein
VSGARRLNPGIARSRYEYVERVSEILADHNAVWELLESDLSWTPASEPTVADPEDGSIGTPNHDQSVSRGRMIDRRNC